MIAHGTYQSPDASQEIPRYTTRNDGPSESLKELVLKDMLVYYRSMDPRTEIREQNWTGAWGSSLREKLDAMSAEIDEANRARPPEERVRDWYATKKAQHRRRRSNEAPTENDYPTWVVFSSSVLRGVAWAQSTIKYFGKQFADIPAEDEESLIEFLVEHNIVLRRNAELVKGHLLAAMAYALAVFTHIPPRTQTGAIMQTEIAGGAAATNGDDIEVRGVKSPSKHNLISVWLLNMSEINLCFDGEFTPRTSTPSQLVAAAPPAISVCIIAPVCVRGGTWV